MLSADDAVFFFLFESQLQHFNTQVNTQETLDIRKLDKKETTDPFNAHYTVRAKKNKKRKFLLALLQLATILFDEIHQQICVSHIDQIDPIFCLFVLTVPSQAKNNRTSSYTSIPSSSNQSTGTNSSHNGEPEIAIFPYFTEGKAVIVDINRITEALDADIQNSVQWPNHLLILRERTDVNSWDGWFPRIGMIADIVHEWKPNSKDKFRQSHLKKSIFLLRIDDYSVPVLEDGINVLSGRSTDHPTPFT